MIQVKLFLPCAVGGCSLCASGLESEDWCIQSAGAKVGCGFGGLVDHLPECQYTGIDLVTEFVEEARSGHLGRLFEVTNLASERKSYDWCVMACLLNGAPEPEELFLQSWAVSRLPPGHLRAASLASTVPRVRRISQHGDRMQHLRLELFDR